MVKYYSMKFLTRLFLEKYLFQNTYGENADYLLTNLFKEFSTREIKSIDDVRKSGIEFFRFIKTHKNKIIRKTASPDGFFEEAERIAAGLEYATNPVHQKDKRLFVDISKEFMSSRNTKILDVGSGVVPFSSYLFAQEYDHVSAMDKFIVTLEFLESLNIDGIEEYFKPDTSVSDYDFVVGKCPCSAIPYMVDNCIKDNKPYFIELCECELPKINPYTGKRPANWQEILVEMDSGIRFYDDYAFHIDATDEQAKRMIEKHIEHTPSGVMMDAFTRFLYDIVQHNRENQLLNQLLGKF